ncbi:hypothetical protein M422DRAFT_239679 [Sphaerobolus stellatus SS14]|nr:hypothetical protein M422DRAFT_239679 [Sphaerobolus stellatus SS14]
MDDYDQGHRPSPATASNAHRALPPKNSRLRVAIGSTDITSNAIQYRVPTIPAAKKGRPRSESQRLGKANSEEPRAIRPLPSSSRARVVKSQPQLPLKLRFRSRDFYPLAHHQDEFDKWERAHRKPYALANGPAPGEGGNLMDLEDPIPGLNDDQQPHPHCEVVTAAIYGSPTQRLTLKELKIALRRRFPWYATGGHNPGWVNSVRHMLSIEPRFQKIPKPDKDYTKGGDQGGWWTLDMECIRKECEDAKASSTIGGIDQIKPAKMHRIASSYKPQAIPSQLADNQTNHPAQWKAALPKSILLAASVKPTPALPSLQTTGLLDVHEWVPRHSTPRTPTRDSTDVALMRTLTLGNTSKGLVKMGLYL